MYCEECFEDMEKNGFVIKIATRKKSHRALMMCPMCLDDCTPDVKVFSSATSTNEYTQKARMMRQSEESGLGYKDK